MKATSPAVTRRAEEADIERLIELRKHLLSGGEGHYAAQSPEEEFAWQSSYRQWLLKNLRDNPLVLVAAASVEEKGEIIACAIGIIDERAPLKGILNGRSGWIQTVVVDLQWRRQGVAEQVMEYVLSWFWEQEVGKIVLQTTSVAKHLYERLGFEETGEELLYKQLL
ncbi:GNAT family N-acetyltransferase [Paenibacillus sp. SYP-B3998]|uniref:GNAT family N-acetyltransferase n=1 Tax=Paenibacillus sp. SYP-B3998 TaxID=2678564 RepID=A0A6G3ZUQ4_9BACL|nr:GNAT family N-acetyltransferase [Paenibacillus sp. SYP-B3998]NEW05800.1 GNAT family N-acetyltransferase [Paenibacillus sp. SYP-B3998]